MSNAHLDLKSDSCRFALSFPDSEVFLFGIFASFSAIFFAKKCTGVTADIGLLLLVSMTAALAYRVARRGVIVDRGGLLVRELFSQCFIAHQDIVAIEPSLGGMTLPPEPMPLSDKIEIRVSTGKSTFLRVALGRPSTTAMLREIERRRRDFVGAASTDAGVASEAGDVLASQTAWKSTAQVDAFRVDSGDSVGRWRYKVRFSDLDDWRVSEYSYLYDAGALSAGIAAIGEIDPEAAPMLERILRDRIPDSDSDYASGGIASG